MLRHWQHHKWLIGALLLSVATVSSNNPAIAGENEQAAALYNSAKLWSPLNFNNDKIWYVDPNSVHKVSEHEWDINLTALNNSNQYLLGETKTYRINCQNLDVLPLIGWRINGYLQPKKWLFGSLDKNAQRFKASPTQVIWTAKEYVCGVQKSESTYHFLYSAFRQGQLRGPIDQLWIKDNVVQVSQNDTNLRRIGTMVSLLGGATPAFREFYVKCDKREWMDSENGVMATEWAASPAGGFFDIVFEKMCSGSAKFISYQSTSFAMPKPITKSATSEQSQTPSDIQGAKQKCLALGFKTGTPKFGQCVLKLSQ